MHAYEHDYSSASVHVRRSTLLGLERQTLILIEHDERSSSDPEMFEADETG